MGDSTRGCIAQIFIKVKKIIRIFFFVIYKIVDFWALVAGYNTGNW
jgi:hypothetical protein